MSFSRWLVLVAAFGALAACAPQVAHGETCSEPNRQTESGGNLYRCTAYNPEWGQFFDDKNGGVRLPVEQLVQEGYTELRWERL